MPNRRSQHACSMAVEWGIIYAFVKECCNLLQGLLAELLMHKPADPKQYIIAQLEKIKVAGTKPLLDVQDLSTMFGMFDVTKRGVVTEEQANQALRTVLGCRAPQHNVSGASASALCQQDFIAYMSEALQAATPLCKS